jgi:alkylhydroperoxidase family enzyme
VWEGGHRVTDATIEALKQEGCSEDEILEATLAAALGSADRTLKAGLEALHPER